MDKNIDLFYLLQMGYSYQDSHNLPKACEYYETARDYARKIYGDNNKICNIVSLFDYVWEEYQGDYKAAAMKLADVGELLENFSKQSVKDEFTEWIYSNKEELLDAAVVSTYEIFGRFGFKLDIEKLFIHILSGIRDVEEVMNQIMIDPLGLPRRFHYYIQNFSKNSFNDNIEARQGLAELLFFMKEIKDKNIDMLSEKEKMDLVKKMDTLMQQNTDLFEKYNLSSGLSKIMRSSKLRIDFDIARGMMRFEDTDYVERFLGKHKEKDIGDITDNIKMMILECWLQYDKKNNRKEAEKILDNILELENSIIVQVFFLREEKKKIEFLNGLSYITKCIIEICYQIRGARAAYSVVLRTRTLSFDRAVLHLESQVHKQAILRLYQLEQIEKQNIKTIQEKAELEEQLAEASGGIFTLDSIEICRKLTNKQAVIEFTIMTDFYDCDFYYAFVVTARNIFAVQLGKCNEIDMDLDKLRQFVENYINTKHGDSQIRKQKAYYNIYEKVLLPIRKVLPREVHSLFIAAVGKFFHIPFGMLPSFYWYDGFMEDEYQIFYINSGKEILHTIKTERNHGAIVIGDIDFEGRYPQLPASSREVKAVADMLKVTPITGKNATSDCLNNPTGIFHISTHSNKSNNYLESNKDPMDQIGLVFAGGEFFTIKKISQLNLSGTNLVVLSVCGIMETEGVYSDIGLGIRRAFINAGVRFIILNLWKTDDYATELLMKCFYDYYINKSTGIEESLKKAKHFLRVSTISDIKKSSYYDRNIDSVVNLMNDEEKPYIHPYYWAGFILVGI